MNVNLNFFGWNRPPVDEKKLDEILTTLKRVSMDIHTLTEKVDAVSAQLEKANAEIAAAKARDEQMRQALLDEIDSLRASLADAQVPEETEASINRLMGIAQATDNLNPDEPEPEQSSDPDPASGDFEPEAPAQETETETDSETETGVA